MEHNPVALTGQARYHFSRLDQIDSLIRAADADCGIGYMGRLLALCSLPRTNPGTRHQYKRVNGPYTLYMNAVADNKLPFGHIPRLLLAWVCTEAVRTQSRELLLGKTLSDFMRDVGIDPAGASFARVRTQMNRLFGCSITLLYQDHIGSARVSSHIADRHEFWWSHVKPEDRGQWQSKIVLGESFFGEITRNPLPLDMHILRALSRASLGLDLYQWLNYRTFALDHPLRLSWKQLYTQFGADPAHATNHETVNSFRKQVLRELIKIKIAWPGLDYATPRGALELLPTTTPSVPPLQFPLLSR